MFFFFFWVEKTGVSLIEKKWNKGEKKNKEKKQKKRGTRSEDLLTFISGKIVQKSSMDALGQNRKSLPKCIFQPHSDPVSKPIKPFAISTPSKQNPQQPHSFTHHSNPRYIKIPPNLNRIPSPSFLTHRQQKFITVSKNQLRKKERVCCLLLKEGNQETVL